MLGRWLFVRIRAAERALHEGRIDEAYAGATQPDVRAHRRGQKLLDSLAKPLVARARLKLQAGRYRDALDDLDKLRLIDRSGPDAERLRRRALDHLHARQQDDAERRRDLDRAAADLQAGRLESGRLVIEQVQDTQRREELREQLDIRVQRSAELLAQAGEALNRQDVGNALRLWQEAHQRHGRTRDSDEFAAQLANTYARTLDEWFIAGHLERLAAARAGLEVLREFNGALDEHVQIVALCARGSAQLADRDYPGLRATLLRLRSARAEAAWLEEGLTALETITEAQEALLASPLGLLASSGGAKVAPPTLTRPQPEPATPRPAAPAPDPQATRLGPAPLLMLVDGAGSSLLVSQDCARIGRAGSRAPLEIPVPADIHSHHADIIRDGEDYFLTAYGQVRVNQRSVTRTLLRHGDRITLGAKAKLVFHKPSRKSDSAVLKLSPRSRLPQDVSDVILFRETCLIGPQPSCHITTRDTDTQVVLFDRGGRLYGRQATAGGGKLGDAKPLRPGETVDFGEVRVTIKTYTPPDSGRFA